MIVVFYNYWGNILPMNDADSPFSNKNHPMPFTRVEVVVMSLVEGTLKVLLAKRKEQPFAGKWALPGGVLRTDLDQSLEAAAQRVIQERLGTKLLHVEQLCAVGGPKRDPRSPWALSLVYRALLPYDEVQASAGKRIEALEWRNATESMEDEALAFDHAGLIARAVAKTRRQIEAIEIPPGMLHDEFTLGELQLSCEQVLGRPLDKSSFRRKLSDREAVEAVAGAVRRGSFRPAQMYRSKQSPSQSEQLTA